MDKLDVEFDVIAEEINAKIKEAAAALKVVNDLRQKAGLTSLIGTQWAFDDLDEKESDEMEAKLAKIHVGLLEREISSAGWSTSSSYC